MIHIRNSKPNSIFLLENEGVPSGTLTDFNETIIDGSLCIDITNQNMYLLKSGTWTLVNGGVGGNYLPIAGGTMGGALTLADGAVFQFGFLFGNNGNPSVFYNNRKLVDVNGGAALDWVDKTIGLGISSNANWAYLKSDNITTTNKTFQFPNKNGTIALLDDVSAATAGNGLTLHNNIIDIGGNILQNTRLDLQNDYNLAIDNFKNFNISGSNFISNTNKITINSTEPIFSNGALTSIRTNTFDPDMGNGFCFGVKNYSTSGGADYLNYLNMSDYYGTVLYQSRFAENGSLSVGYGSIVAQVVSGTDTTNINMIPTNLDITSPNISIQGNGIIKDNNFNNSLDWTNRTLNSQLEDITLDWKNYIMFSTSGDGGTPAYLSVNWGDRKLFTDIGDISFDWNNRKTFNSSNQNTIDWEIGSLYNQGGNISIDWEGNQINDYDGLPSVDSNNRMLYAADSEYSWSVNFGQRKLHSNFSNLLSLDWEERKMYGSDGATIAAEWGTGEVIFPTIGAITVPVGLTVDRPSSPTVGMLRFNIDINKGEMYDGSVWQPLW